MVGILTRRKGQALLEMALMSMFLALLLAGAVDFGRAFYTAVVVSNMAAEGAAYASLNPDRDLVDSSCSQFPVVAYKNIQDRVRLVAAERGLVIKQQDRDAATIEITTPGYSNPTRCDNRCLGRSINVKVTYVINDLFLPNLLGMRNITISRSATQQIQRNAYAASCP
jgi:hypothetical protein